MSFRLVKWYGDVTTERSEALILYAADLGPPLAMHYASVLDASGPEPALAHSLRSWTVARGEQGWAWTAAGVQVEACFTPLREAAGLDVLAEAPGAVRWHPLAPLCQTRVEIAGRRFDGLGYLERLELNLPPWQLPLGRLVWGRFVHPEASLVWLDWAVPDVVSIVLHDGVRVEGTVSADLVEGPGFRLTLEERRLLREGTLGRVALAGIALVSRVAPAGFLATTERKRLARGTLRRGGKVLQGWVIDEVVTWAA